MGQVAIAKNSKKIEGGNSDAKSNYLSQQSVINGQNIYDADNEISRTRKFETATPKFGAVISVRIEELFKGCPFIIFQEKLKTYVMNILDNPY